MGTVERADCTQINVEDQEFKILFPASGTSSPIYPKATRVDIEFQACQGYDHYGRNDNNDLWSYMNRLWREGKVAPEQMVLLNKKLVGEQPDRCNLRTEEFMHDNGYIMGYNQDRTMWTVAAGKGVLEDPGVSLDGFNKLMDDAPKHPDVNTTEGQIIKRMCVDCHSEPHQEIYYKRVTPIPDGFDLLANLKNERSLKAGNEWNKDFKLYSTYEDAVNDVNAWKCPSNTYRYNNGFPGLCSPTGRLTHHQDTRFFWPHGRQHVSFSVEVNQDNSRLRVTPGNEDGYLLNKLDETYELGNTYQPGAAYEFVDPATNDTKINMVGYGKDIWNQQDSATYHANNITIGDKFEVIAKIESCKGPHYWSKCGIMVRQDPMSANAKNVFFARNPIGDLWISRRSAPGERTHSPHRTRNYFDGANAQGGYWLKMKYDSGYIHTYVGTEDSGNTGSISWTVFTSPMQIVFDGDLHVGVAVSSQYDYAPVETIYSGYETTSHVCQAQRRKLHATSRAGLELGEIYTGLGKEL